MAAPTVAALLFLLSVLSSSALALPVPKEQEMDRISALPGQPPVAFSQFSGYVKVNEEHGRALFYWLTEATTSPEKKPLVLWLNGGPGCSSIAYGASEEIGPFRINRTASSLYMNKYSWNREANLLFLESPAGVGFSYTNTSSNLKDSGDKRTAQDALIFLIRWMSRFPQYKYRELYISGESYAGHYVPQLAKKIHDYNKGQSHPIINLKGFIVGNAVTDNYYDNMGTVSYWWTHSMISDTTYKSILKHCNFSSEDSKKCDDWVSYAMNHEFGNIDQYSIYTPSCLRLPNSTARVLRFGNTLLRRRVLSGYDPCTENYAERYYNRPDVQRAMHANGTGINYKWTACSDALIQNWKDSDTSMLPIYKELMAAGLRIWVFRIRGFFNRLSNSNPDFGKPGLPWPLNVLIMDIHLSSHDSGDTDSIVPVTATRFSLSHLNLPIKTRWYPWYAGDQVGGWTEVYDGLTFATVRGAGHEVPLFQPKRAFILFKSFLAGDKLPDS